VVDSAIKSATKTRVEVLLFVDQSVTNTVNPQPRIDRSRVAITMELVDNRWLASKVDLK
jgi:Mce-associated membrane protein